MTHHLLSNMFVDMSYSLSDVYIGHKMSSMPDVIRLGK